MVYKVGDGRVVDFWTDIWIGEVPLATQFQPIYYAVLRKNLRVHDCYGTNGWRWRKICSGFNPQTQPDRALLADFKDTLCRIQPNDGCDEVGWRWGRTNVFTVKSLYSFLHDTGVVDGRFDELWKLKLPLKVKIFVWLVLRKRVLTVDLLLKRGWSGADTCVMCLGPMESVDHLFVGCAFSYNILATLLPLSNALRTSEGVQNLWKAITGNSGRSGSSQSRNLSNIAITWWTVWLERNRRRFENKIRDLRVILEDIRCHRDLWLANCS